MSAPAEIPSPLSLQTHHAGWRATFSSLRTRNYRLFASGQIVSNTGSWVQRIAQDWLVLSLTGSATAVGITTALQLLPSVLFGLVGGLIADRYPKRLVLLATQIGAGSMAALLAALTLSHNVQVWHVYLIAFALGTVIAVDNPTRQAFVTEMVGPDQLHNAVSLNSSVFQLGGLVGPAISGVLLNLVGAGWSFLINAVSYLAPAISLVLMRESELYRGAVPAERRRGGALRDTLRYVAATPAVLWPTILVGAFGLFVANLPVTLAAYAKSEFHSGAGGYGLLSSVVAVGSLCGALVSARRGQTRLRSIAAIGGGLAVAEILAAAAPGQWAFAVVLVAVGAGTLLLFTSANSTVQLATGDAIRGRVMSVYLLAFTGCGALGGPLVGAIDQHLGPKIGMLLAGVVPGLVTVLVAARLARRGQLRLVLRPAGARRPLVAVVSR